MSDEKKRLLQEIQKFMSYINLLEHKNLNMDILPGLDRSLWNQMMSYINSQKDNDDFFLQIPEAQVPFYLQMIAQINTLIQDQFAEESIDFSENELLYGVEEAEQQPVLEEEISADGIINTIDKEIPIMHRILLSIQKLDQELLPVADPQTTDTLLDIRSELLQRLKQCS
jgi:hypothetical protein